MKIEEQKEDIGLLFRQKLIKVSSVQVETKDGEIIKLSDFTDCEFLDLHQIVFGTYQNESELTLGVKIIMGLIGGE